MEPIQHIEHDNKEEKGWLQSLWVLMFPTLLFFIFVLIIIFK